MATAFEHGSEKHLLEVETGGSLVEAVGGAGVIVLSILGLTGLSEVLLASVAGIVFGVALLAEGTAIASEFSKLFSKIAGDAVGTVELGGGMTIEIVAGIATVVLGILALVGQASEFLLPALVIAAGITLILTTGTLQRLNDLRMQASDVPQIAQEVAHATVSGAAAAQLLAGLAAIVLGILALVSVGGAAPGATATAGSWTTLTLVGLLVLGGAIMMSGGSLTGRLLQMVKPRQSASS